MIACFNWYVLSMVKPMLFNEPVHLFIFYMSDTKYKSSAINITIVAVKLVLAVTKLFRV